MLYFPEIDPVAIALGPFKVRWYGLMYLCGFSFGYLYLVKTASKQSVPFNKEQILDLIFYLAIGIILGGRIGYILFYEPGLILTEPLSLIKFWEPGRSFHAGLLGGAAVICIYAKKHKMRFLHITDYIAPAVPIGLAFGRIGNFLNAELWGRVTDVSWGVIFPYAGPYPRHPSQIYEFLLEGVLLFIILVIYSKSPRKLGAVTGMFLLLYGIFRFFVELYREPDAFLGFIFKWLTMGQLLSIPLILIGLWLLLRKSENQKASVLRAN